MRKEKRSGGLKTQIMIRTLIPVVLCFLFLCVIIFISLFNSLHNTARAEFSRMGQKYSAAFESKVTNALNYLSISIAALEPRIKAGEADREELQNELYRIFEDNGLVDSSSLYLEPEVFGGGERNKAGSDPGAGGSEIMSFYLYRDKGKTEAASDAAHEEDSPAHYFEVRQADKPIYTAPVNYLIDGRSVPVFTLTYPLRGQDGVFAGAVTAELLVEDINNELQNERIYETGFIIISDEKGRIICAPGYENAEKKFGELGIDLTPLSREEMGDIYEFETASNGERSLVTISAVYIPRLDGRFLVTVAAPLGEIYAYGTGLMAVVLTLGILVVIMIALLLYFLISKMTRPIKEITESADKIARGDYSSRIAGDYRDEFAAVKTAMNTMAENIQSYIEGSAHSLNILKSIMNGLDAFIYVTAPDTGEILFINEKMRKHFNITGDAVGQYCYKVLQQGIDGRCEFCPCYQLDKEPDKPVVWEEHNTVTKRIYRNTDRYIDWIGGVKVHLQHSVDITDLNTAMNDKIKAEREAFELLHEKERAEETSRMKSVFLANMSHEIRTPMNGIIGFSELAIDDDISDKTKDYLTKIKTSAESLLQIINNILDISKIESGKVELEKIPFELSEVFKLCRVIITPEVEKKGLTLFCYAEPSTKKMLLGDPTRLRQALVNLLSNAVKFTNTGMIKLLSSINGHTDNTISVHFEVKDNGIGLTAGQIKKIFKPFVQADDSMTRRFGGTGLGLAITKSIVELMGGELKVESALGLGSKFCFDLTFETIDKTDELTAKKEVSDSVEKPEFSARILVCEDNELNQQLIFDHLSRVGIKAIIAPNGKIGVKLVKQQMEKGEKPFDLILMDIHMPEMDGLEAAKELSKLGSKIPIIALTANIMVDDKETYFAAGMSDCVSKPFTTKELWSCLLKYIAPVGLKTSRKSEEQQEEERQRRVLISSFIRKNRTAFEDISNAASSGDIRLAHRLAHTLKGVAGVIGLSGLHEAAGAVERSLADGKAHPTPEQMKNLELELNTALARLSALADGGGSAGSAAEPLGRAQAIELLTKLDGLLENDSFDCLNFTADLGSIPGTELLIEQVEGFMFKPARETLAEIMHKVESGHG